MSKDLSVTRREAIASIGAAALASAALADTKTPVAPLTGRANPQGRFASKVVLITGGTSGIGKATAYAFAREGARVGFCGRREELGKANAAEIAAFGGQAIFIRADVSRESDVEGFVKAVVDRWGRLDIAFNNAGIDRPSKPLHETDAATHRELMAVNLDGVFFSLKHEIAQMLRQTEPGGCIVNVSSVGGYRGYPGVGTYSASKAGVLSLTRTAASEYSEKNIRVTSVSPGPIVTPMLERAVKDWNLPGLEAFAGGAANKRNGTPEEIARAVVWLCSPEASYLAGTDVLIDGGYLLK